MSSRHDRSVDERFSVARPDHRPFKSVTLRLPLENDRPHRRTCIAENANGQARTGGGTEGGASDFDSMIPRRHARGEPSGTTIQFWQSPRGTISASGHVGIALHVLSPLALPRLTPVAKQLWRPD
jgi:hypothetical protein